MKVDVTVGELVDVSVEVAVLATVFVRVAVEVAVFVGVAGIEIIWMAFTIALSVLAGPKVIVIVPPLGEMPLNTSSIALF